MTLTVASPLYAERKRERERDWKVSRLQMQNICALAGIAWLFWETKFTEPLAGIPMGEICLPGRGLLPSLGRLWIHLEANMGAWGFWDDLLSVQTPTEGKYLRGREVFGNDWERFDEQVNAGWWVSYMQTLLKRSLQLKEWNHPELQQTLWK